MEVPKDNSSIALVELESWKSAECFQRFLKSQKELVHSQIDQLQNIVVTQCKLTGANPLSQEMAAGALSINIGKRPRDLLNPKAIKYMQSIFSVKDAVSKKESREISALCGVTVTQVREFFAGQRARVRKLVRLSREKAIKSDACKISQDECFPGSDASIPVINPAPLNSVDPKTAEEAPSCSSQGLAIPGIDDSDKTFVDNIFSLMRKEVTFSGQVKLIEWILQIQNSSVLNWFLNQGGLMILTAWLGEAALEEQTTVLLAIFKVLCHLPLHKALPMQMSAILQTVNRLRFYRISDISNRAKVLLSRWSKIFVRNQALKKPSFTNSTKDAHKERILKQSTREIPGNEWQSKVDLPEEIFHLAFESSENIRNSESSPATKLLTSSTDDSNKKQNRGVSPAQTRERRKVLPMEQPGQNNISRNIQAARALPSNQGRPMSADDIQKAKMRAMFTQSKYGKNGSSNENQQQKIENLNKSCTSQTMHQLSASKVLLEHKIEEGSNPKMLAVEPSMLPKVPKTLASETSTFSERPIGSKPKGPSWEELKMNQIPWHMPSEVKINSLWRVGVGEKSKEVEVQIGRTKREKETIYQRLQDIPSNPKEPWDLEIDYDDTLTPEIPTEQPPEADVAEPSLPSPHPIKTTTETHVASQPPPPPLTNTNTNTNTNTTEAAPEPDLELLAVLLKHPELVFALTSGQGTSSSSLTSADTVRLLDMIKSSQTDLTTVLNGLKGDAKKAEPEPVSLPSPTPPSERIMNEWRPEVVSRPIPILPTTLPIQPSQDWLFANALAVQPQTQMPNFSLTQLRTTVTLTQQLPIPLNARSFPVASLLEQQFPVMNSISNQVATNPSQQRVQSLQPESINYGQMQTLKPSPPIVQTPHKDRLLPITSPPLQTVLPGHHGMMMLQPHQQPEPQLQPVQHTMQWNSLSTNSSSSSSFRQNSFGGSGSNHWSQSNQNNYNIYPAVAPELLSERERNDYLVEPEFETWSPARRPERSRSPEYPFRQDYSESRRDSSRSSITDWYRRRDSGRRDHRHASSRRWRDRRL